jgi:hypothetical protein
MTGCGVNVRLGLSRAGSWIRAGGIDAGTG